MIETKKIEFPGIDGVVENIDHYLDIFLEDGILVFRNANLSHEDQEILQIKMADKFKWSPGPNRGEIHRYTENHKNLVDPQFGSEDLMLDWHMEHIYWANPIVAGLWNMLKFTTNSKNGKTYFYDMRKLFSRLESIDQHFLGHSQINVYSYIDNEMRKTRPSQEHWITKEHVLRMPLRGYKKGFNDLKKFGNMEGDSKYFNQHQNEYYLALANRIKDTVQNDLDNRIVHEWKQGDLVIPDLFVMAHAVTGGFDPSEREFTGLWAFREDNVRIRNY